MWEHPHDFLAFFGSIGRLNEMKRMIDRLTIKIKVFQLIVSHLFVKVYDRPFLYKCFDDK